MLQDAIMAEAALRARSGCGAGASGAAAVTCCSNPDAAHASTRSTHSMRTQSSDLDCAVSIPSILKSRCDLPPALGSLRRSGVPRVVTGSPPGYPAALPLVVCMMC